MYSALQKHDFDMTGREGENFYICVDLSSLSIFSAQRGIRGYEHY